MMDNTKNLYELRVGAEKLKEIELALQYIQDVLASISNLAISGDIITEVNNALPEITTCADNITSIVTCSDNILDINALADEILNIVLCADNLADIVNVSTNLDAIINAAALLGVEHAYKVKDISSVVYNVNGDIDRQNYLDNSFTTYQYYAVTNNLQFVNYYSTDGVTYLGRIEITYDTNDNLQTKTWTGA